MNHRICRHFLRSSIPRDPDAAPIVLTIEQLRQGEVDVMFGKELGRAPEFHREAV